MDFLAKRYGFRGYIASRPIGGNRIPQHVQNLVIRDYANRNGLGYLLSAAEFSIPESIIVLNDVLAELDVLEGIICYSIHMLPGDSTRRQAIISRILDAGCSLHAAVENIVIDDGTSAVSLESIFAVDKLVDEARQILAQT